MWNTLKGRNKKAGYPFNNEAGVTLLELIVAMVMAGMLLGAAVMVFMGQNKAYNRQDIIAEVQQNVRAALTMMASEIRIVGYDPAQKGGAGFTSATQSGLSFDYWEDTDGDGSYNDETIKTLTYDRYDAGSGVFNIGRLVGDTATAKRPLAENIDQLRFEYLTGITTPKPGSGPAMVQR